MEFRNINCTACGGNNWEICLGTASVIMVCRACEAVGFGSVRADLDRQYGLIVHRSHSTFDTADHALAFVDAEPIKL